MTGTGRCGRPAASSNANAPNPAEAVVNALAGED